MLSVLIVYIISGFVSILLTDFILHDGSVVNIMLVTFILQFVILFVMKRVNLKELFRKVKVEKEIFFWCINYLVANTFGIYLIYKLFKINAIGEEFSQVEKISTILILSIFLPVLEEIFYRGIICSELLKKNSALITIITSGLIFCITHGIARGLIFLILGSTFYKSYIYIKSKSVYNSIIIHIINNTIMSIVIFYNNSTYWLEFKDLEKYHTMFYVLGGLSIIMCVYNNYRMYTHLKEIDKENPNLDKIFV